MSPRADESFGEAPSTTEGLAKGVFAFPRKRKAAAGQQSPGSRLKKSKRGGGRKKQAATVPELTDSGLLYEEFSSKEPQWASERVEVHNNLLQIVENKADAIQNSIFQGVYDSLVNFVSNSQKMRESSVRAIPTAVLLTGVNMPDHNKILTMLVKRLKTITPHISVLQSGQNTKQLITNLVQDLMNTEDDDDDEITMVKKCDASFGYLEEWYSNQYAIQDRPPLVLLAQDFENFTGSSLCDLITLCRRYEATLPIVLILGVATTVATVHKTLPQSITSHLTITTFGSPNSSLHLEEVLEAVVVDPEVPFKLSDKVLTFLVENFLYHDFSVNHFLSAYRYILGEHLYRQPGALLLTDEKEALRRVNDMGMEQLTFICRVPSFRYYVESLILREQAETLTNEMVCRETVAILIKEYFEHVRTFTAMVKVLFYLTKDLPRRPMGSKLRNVYQDSLAGGIHNTPQYRESFQFLKLSNRLDLENKLKVTLKEIDGIYSLEDFSKDIVKSLERLEHIKNLPDSFAGSPMVTSDRMSSAQNSLLSSSLNTGCITPIVAREHESPAGASTFEETPGSGAPGSGAPGSGAPGSGAPGSGAPGSGTPGSGAPGSGTPGSGTQGSGTPGSGTQGSGTQGSGTPGPGTSGSGTTCPGTSGSGTPGPAGDRNTRNSPLKTRTPIERATRNSPLKSLGGSTPTERSTRNSPMKIDTPVDRMTRNSPLKQSTPMDLPALDSTGTTPLAFGSMGVTPLGSMGVTPLGSGTSSPYSSVRPAGRLDRLKLHAGLLEAKHRNSIQQSRPFDGVRSDIMTILHDNLKKFLDPPTSRPLHEIFTFSRINFLRDHLIGAPRAAIHTALTDPHVYLENPDLKIADLGEIPASLPDLSVAYKLHLECPRLINIYDWLSCWNSIITQGDQDITKVGQAKFTRAVSELQHLGFIKTSNRKADHVSRLTFGGS